MVEITQALRPAGAASLRAPVWAGIAAVALWGAVRGDWTLALVALACIVLALMPKAFTAVSGLVFPTGFTTGILAFAAAALLLGELAGFYVSVPWWDVALHFVASSVLAIVGMGLAMTPTAGAPPRVAVWVLAVLAFGFSMMVGALWEAMEFSIDTLFGTNTQRSGLPDTMGDVAVNALGATIGAAAGHANIARGARWPLAGLLGRFMDLNPVLYFDRSEER